MLLQCWCSRAACVGRAPVATREAPAAWAWWCVTEVLSLVTCLPLWIVNSGIKMKRWIVAHKLISTLKKKSFFLNVKSGDGEWFVKHSPQIFFMWERKPPPWCLTGELHTVHSSFSPLFPPPLPNPFLLYSYLLWFSSFCGMDGCT